MGAEGKGAHPGQEGVLRVAVDTGGTFTDVMVLQGGALRNLKVPSTPSDPADAVLAGLRRMASGAFDLIHGSTVATNALLERRGARVALVTNRGFEDVIEIGRQNRPQLYALEGHRPPPLVTREDRHGIAGRLGPEGGEEEPLDPAELDGLGERLGEGVESLAVCLLHAYADPSHEEAVARVLEDLGLPLSVSSRILPEFREFERTATTVVNAYVAPKMAGYLGRLGRECGAARFRVMASGGGALPVERAVGEPVQTVLSGPAGGVVGALEWGRRAGYPHILSFDMGGTSTDVALCPDRLLQTREFAIGGTPVALPVLDIHTVGAGGGSIAQLDPAGALRVGPESAGADPGPICYGRGGRQVTVTDAHVWLGRLPLGGFLGGGYDLDRDAIEGPLAGLARAMSATPDEVALGILEIANTAMERALRVISVERGHDPREFALVAFGGAGGLHGAELAGRIGVETVVIPPNPGLLSAFGMLVAPVVREVSRTLLLRSDAPEADHRVLRALEILEEGARNQLDREGFSSEEIQCHRWVDARAVGQSFELRVPARDWVRGFHRAHAERYGYTHEDAPVEAVTVRVQAMAPGAPFQPSELPAADHPAPEHPLTVVLGGVPTRVPGLWREDLRPGHRVEGPAVVQEYSSTVWVPEGWEAGVDPLGCLLLSRRGSVS